MMAKLKNRKGVTLVELLVALAILSLVAAGTITVLSSGLKTYTLNFNSTVGQQNLRAAMIKISKQARDPANTVAISSPKALTLNGKKFTVSSGVLMCNGVAYANNIASISADYTDATKKVIQVDLTSADGGTLSTKISLD
jgi:prepilin-type N-terminal cleavage/methylation domain-containing protein